MDKSTAYSRLYLRINKCKIFKDESISCDVDSDTNENRAFMENCISYRFPIYTICHNKTTLIKTVLLLVGEC